MGGARKYARDPRHAGFQGVAEALSTEARHVSRQQVYVWWTRRERNGFPDRINEAGTPRFDLAAVREWYANYVPDRGGRPRKDDASDVA